MDRDAHAEPDANAEPHFHLRTVTVYDADGAVLAAGPALVDNGAGADGDTLAIQLFDAGAARRGELLPVRPQPEPDAIDQSDRDPLPLTDAPIVSVTHEHPHGHADDPPSSIAHTHTHEHTGANARRAWVFGHASDAHGHGHGDDEPADRPERFLVGWTEDA